MFACGLAASAAQAEATETAPLALRGVNPDMVSGGLFSALDAIGALGGRPAPARARAGFADPAKGRPPAVLDPRVGPNIRLGDDPAALPTTQRGQAEPHVVRSSVQPGLLLGTFQEGRFADAGALDCGYAVSRDGGRSWTRALIPNLTAISGGRFNRATDPVAGAGPQGDLYLQTLASVQGAFNLAAVVVSRSSDGGATWSGPVAVFESTSALTLPDKNWLAVNDYPGTPNTGRLVCTWTSFQSTATGTPLGNSLVASVSDDRGVTWSTPTAITPAGSSNQGSQPVFLPDGSLAVVYIAFLDPSDVTRFSLHCKLSTDGGRTFSTAATTLSSSVVGWDDPEMRDGVFLPSATVARQTGELFVTYTAVVNGSPRVLVTKSADQGATWSTPVAVSDAPAGVSVMNPAIGVTPDGRSVSVVFMDKRNAPGGRGFVDLYAAQSYDGGLTWQPNLRLTELSSDLGYGTATTRGVMLGDYLGYAPSDGDRPGVALWCDTRTGNADPFAVLLSPSALPNYSAFASVRGIPGSFTDGYLRDTDGDGVQDYLEFLAGTDPTRPESGEDLFVKSSSATTLDVAWTEREVVTKSPAIDGVSVTPARFFLEGGFGLSTTLPASLPPDQMPSTTPPPGLAWRGVRLTVAAGQAEAVTRSIRFSAGIPPTASKTAALINSDSRLINLSTRGQTKPGERELIVGFVLDGNKSILVRASGPALGRLGVSGTLADPVLTLSALASDFFLSNDHWQQAGVDSALFTRLGAFPFAPGSLDAALALAVGPQNYTATVSGAGGSSGVTLVEAYDADAVPGAPDHPRLVNLSTRGEAGVGDDALIAGFVVSGTAPRRILLRAVGPGLARFGVSSPLADPILTLFQGGTALATNDDWEISRSSAAIAATAQRIGAFALPPASLDAALLITLFPGTYTVVIAGADGGTGVALVEVYDAN